MFWKRKSTGANKKIDKLVTGIIIGGAVASMVGLSKTKKWKKMTEKVVDNTGKYAKKGVGVLWKTMVWILSIFNKKK